MQCIIVNGDFITRWKNIIFAPWRISYDNKIARFSSRNSPRGDFHPACLAAIWTNRTICAWNKGYIFVNFTQTPTSTSNLSTSLESQWNIESKDILSVRKLGKYCQLFTHESNTFLDDQYVIPPIQTNGAQMQKNPPNSPFPRGMWTLI